MEEEPMFKTFGTMLLAACLLLPTSALAADMTGFYLAPKFALNVQHAEGELSYAGQTLGSDSKTGCRAGGALAAGYDFAPVFQVPIRAELEYGAYGNVSKTKDLGYDSTFKATMSFQTLLANVYWDITDWKGFKPYVGAGIGMAFLKTEGRLSLLNDSYVDSEDNTEAVLAGQAGLGFSYAFTDHVAADFGWRFLIMGDGSAEKDSVKLDARENYAHQFMMGLRISF